MASFNQATLIGTVGSIDIRTFGEGNKLANISLATSERYTDKNGEKKELTQWHKCVAGGNWAEAIEKYIQKGDLLLVVGSISYRRYTDKEGNERSTTDIRISHFRKLSSGKSTTASPGYKTSGNEDETQDLPF